MPHDLESSVVDWIIDHPETEPVFRQRGIDCSCGGKSLGFLCAAQGLNAEEILAELKQVILLQGGR